MQTLPSSDRLTPASPATDLAAKLAQAQATIQQLQEQCSRQQHLINDLIATATRPPNGLAQSFEAFRENAEALLQQNESNLKTAQKRAATALLEQSETAYQQQIHLCRTAIDSSPDWIFIKDQNFRYLLVNQSYADAIGKTVDEVIGRDDLELGFPEELVMGSPDKNIRGFREDDIATLSGQRIYNPHDPATVADGSLHVFETEKVPLQNEQGQIFACLGIARDVTRRREAETALQNKATELEQTLNELKRAQSQLIQSEKMFALGEMVGGLAHEINNPINFVHGNLRHLQTYTEELLALIETYQAHYPNPPLEVVEKIEDMDLEFLKDDFQQLMQSAQAGSTRIKDVILSLRAFSRLDEADLKYTDIHHGIENTLFLLKHRLKAKRDRPAIEIDQDFGALPAVECFPGQLNQVMMHLLNNAIDAIEERTQNEQKRADQEGPEQKENKKRAPQRSIRIRTEQVNEKAIAIHIADTGTGISPEIQPRIFDPFFTHKPVGQGRGLGLSISYQIVTQKHQGSLEYHSTVGEGTEFSITLPVRSASSS